MARPAKVQIKFFPHYVDHGRKMFVIEQKHGNDGFTFWFKLLELLAKAPNHYLQINDEGQFLYLCSFARVTEQKAIDILDDLARLDAINSELYHNHGVVYSQKFVESLAEAYRRSVLKPQTANELLQFFGGYCRQKPDIFDNNAEVDGVNDGEKPQIKVNKIKVNKIKENTATVVLPVEVLDKTNPPEIKKEKQKKVAPKKIKNPVEITMPFGTTAFAEMWATWKTYKKEQHRFVYKTELSEQGALVHLSELAQGNEQTAIAIIKQSIGNGWAGLFALKTISGVTPLPQGQKANGAAEAGKIGRVFNANAEAKNIFAAKDQNQ